MPMASGRRLKRGGRIGPSEICHFVDDWAIENVKEIGVGEDLESGQV
jgi:hypothetical protein